MTITPAGAGVTGTGDETLADGKLESLDLSENVPRVGLLRIVIADGNTDVKAPASLSHSRKPWVLVTPTSSSPAIRQLATSLQSVQQAAPLDEFTAFSCAARVTAHEQETVDGVPATHHALTVDVRKVPDSRPGKQQRITAGRSSLPVDRWVDAQGRVLKFTQQLAVSGQQISTLLTVGKYDTPVTVTPPPADQVATD